MLSDRVARARERMDELGVDVLLLSVGADLPYLTGYEAMPLERLTMLVLPREGDARLVVPRLEAPRVVARPDLFEIVPWEETDDPVELVAELIGSKAASAAVGDTTWARFVLDLQLALPGVAWVRGSQVLSEIRMVKDAEEVSALRAAAQEAGVRAAIVGTPCAQVDAAARLVISDAGLGDYFVHRVGHGIGQEAHEDPYMVAGNTRPLVAGHAFSIEPGIYREGRFGMRLEDIVIATDAGPQRLNNAPRDLAVVG